uniref:Uncharacterized protein n=1 Tax=Ditylenchus dipsaci TaxID=166011 RepID=A0A915ELE7_9BILA
MAEATELDSQATTTIQLVTRQDQIQQEHLASATKHRKPVAILHLKHLQATKSDIENFKHSLAEEEVGAKPYTTDVLVGSHHPKDERIKSRIEPLLIYKIHKYPSPVPHST